MEKWLSWRSYTTRIYCWIAGCWHCIRFGIGLNKSHIESKWLYPAMQYCYTCGSVFRGCKFRAIFYWQTRSSIDRCLKSISIYLFYFNCNLITFCGRNNKNISIQKLNAICMMLKKYNITQVFTSYPMILHLLLLVPEFFFPQTRHVLCVQGSATKTLKNSLDIPHRAYKQPRTTPKYLGAGVYTPHFSSPASTESSAKTLARRPKNGFPPLNDWRHP